MKPTILAVVCILLLNSPAANAQFTYSNNTDGVSITITGYTGSGSAITIPTNIDGFTVNNIGDDAFNFKNSLKSLTVPEGVTNVGSYAISSCSALTTVKLPSTLLSIGDGAFDLCPALAALTIPANVTSIGASAFWQCRSLKTLTIPAGVTNIGQSPCGFCASLTSIVVDPNNSYYRSVGGVLFNADKTTLIQVPVGASASYVIPTGVTSIGISAFDGASGLTGITIPDTVTNIGQYAFDSCSKLTSVKIPGSVVSLDDYAFSECPVLATVVISNGVASLGNDVFYDSPALAAITIPSTVTNIGQLAFDVGTKLVNVFFLGDAPVFGGEPFYSDTKAKLYYLPGTAGWTPPTAGLPQILWNPMIETSATNFGVQNNQFGFNITGTTNIPIKVEACTDPATAPWTPLQTTTLTGGSFYFSDLQSASYPNRFYRISPP